MEKTFLKAMYIFFGLVEDRSRERLAVIKKAMDGGMDSLSSDERQDLNLLADYFRAQGTTDEVVGCVRMANE